MRFTFNPGTAESASQTGPERSAATPPPVPARSASTFFLYTGRMENPCSLSAGDNLQKKHTHAHIWGGALISERGGDNRGVKASGEENAGDEISPTIQYIHAFPTGSQIIIKSDNLTLHVLVQYYIIHGESDPTRFLCMCMKNSKCFCSFFVMLPFPEHARGPGAARGPESSHTRVIKELSQQRWKRTYKMEDFPSRTLSVMRVPAASWFDAPLPSLSHPREMVGKEKGGCSPFPRSSYWADILKQECLRSSASLQRKQVKGVGGDHGRGGEEEEGREEEQGQGRG